MKLMLVEASGQTLGQLFSGKASRASYVAAAFASLAPVGGIATLVLCLTASNSDAPQLLVADQLNQGCVLNLVPFVLFYFAAAFNMGLPFGHAIMAPWRDVEDKKHTLLAAHRKRLARMATPVRA